MSWLVLIDETFPTFKSGTILCTQNELITKSRSVQQYYGSTCGVCRVATTRSYSDSDAHEWIDELLSAPIYCIAGHLQNFILQCNHISLTSISRYAPPARVIELLFFQGDVEAGGNVRIEFDESDDGIDFMLVASPPIVYRAILHL